MKKIIGLTGPMASGKDAVKKYIEEKYGAKSVKFSQIIRDVLNRLRVPVSRDSMINMSLSLIDQFGKDILAKNIVEDSKEETADIVILDGVRRPADIIYAKDNDSFILIGIDADINIRYERMKSRNENLGDYNKTLEEFKEEHNLETEIMIPELLKDADYVLSNNGSLEDLYKQVDEIMENI